MKQWQERLINQSRRVYNLFPFESTNQQTVMYAQLSYLQQICLCLARKIEEGRQDKIDTQTFEHIENAGRVACIKESWKSKQYQKKGKAIAYFKVKIATFLGRQGTCHRWQTACDHQLMNSAPQKDFR